MALKSRGTDYEAFTNGYSDLVVMSAEYYDRFARENRIDQALFEVKVISKCSIEQL
jgi:hypothetical protein